MKFRTISVTAIGASLLAAAIAFTPAADAGSVAWSINLGGPGFAVAAGQPGYGGRGYYGGNAYYSGNGNYGAPYRPYYRSWYRPVALPPPVVYAAPAIAYPYYASAPVFYAPRPVVYAPRPIFYAPRPIFHAPRPVVYAPRAVAYGARPVAYAARGYVGAFPAPGFSSY